VLDSILKPVASMELPKEVFTSRVRWMPLIIERNASTNMFYLLKNLLLLILVIFKLKCNNLILNEIMVLNASYVCLHGILALSRITRSGSWKADPSFLRWFYHRYSETLVSFNFFLIDMNGIIIVMSFHIFIISMSVHFRINFIYFPTIFS
jgi:hypothetical protein